MEALTGWWLNLDAELELERPDQYVPDPRVQARIAPLVLTLGPLLGEHAAIIGDRPPPKETPTLAWCPTRHAVASIEGAGLTPPAHPSMDVLRRVNHRGFCAALGQTLVGATQVTDLDALRERVRGPSPTGDWVIKRPFGFAGRERRRAIGGELDPSTEGFARAAFARGESLQVEPWVRRIHDVALHGWLTRDGAAHFAEPITQRCDSQGRWQARGGLAKHVLEPAYLKQLEQEARQVATALEEAGYFGPFGLDGYVYIDATGASAFNPRSEINARFTMGFQWPKGVDPRGT